MSAEQAACAFAEIAQKWRTLIDRRCADLVELRRTEGWRYHYGEPEFAEIAREALALAQTWRTLAPRPEDEAVGEPRLPPRRAAA
jgi:hypothetical protein